jgi:hypothetical protein
VHAPAGHSDRDHVVGLDPDFLDGRAVDQCAHGGYQEAEDEQQHGDGDEPARPQQLVVRMAAEVATDREWVPEGRPGRRVGGQVQQVPRLVGQSGPRDPCARHADDDQ